MGQLLEDCLDHMQLQKPQIFGVHRLPNGAEVRGCEGGWEEAWGKARRSKEQEVREGRGQAPVVHARYGEAG